MKQSILIVGSGAVGAVYGNALIRAGCDVTFLVRSRNSSRAAMPRVLYRYRPIAGGYKVEIQNVPVIEQITNGYDQVWLCTPSDAVDSPWLEQHLGQIGPQTPVIVWTPGIQDIDLLRSLHAGPICQGLIDIIGFQTPLPGEEQPPVGIGYLAPPGSAVLQKDAFGQEAARLLKAGGIPAHTRSNLAWWEARLASVSICAVAALEQENWSLAQLKRSPTLHLASHAAIEARQACAAYLGITSSHVRLHRYSNTLILRTILSLAPRVLPFSFETFLHYHFSKVGNQTRRMIMGWIERCNEHTLPNDHLKQLLSGLA